MPSPARGLRLAERIRSELAEMLLRESADPRFNA